MRTIRSESVGLPVPRSGLKRDVENPFYSANKRRWSYRLLMDSFENSVEIVREPHNSLNVSGFSKNTSSSSTICSDDSAFSKNLTGSNFDGTLSDISLSSDHSVESENSLSDAFSIFNTKTGEEIKLKLSIFQGKFSVNILRQSVMIFVVGQETDEEKTDWDLKLFGKVVLKNLVGGHVAFFTGFGGKNQNDQIDEDEAEISVCHENGESSPKAENVPAGESNSTLFLVLIFE